MEDSPGRHGSSVPSRKRDLVIVGGTVRQDETTWVED